MDWIKTKEGYVRQDAIIDVHISPYYPKTIFFHLISGDTIKFQDFKAETDAAKALEQIVDKLDVDLLD